MFKNNLNLENKLKKSCKKLSPLKILYMFLRAMGCHSPLALQYAVGFFVFVVSFCFKIGFITFCLSTHNLVIIWLVSTFWVL